MARFNTEGLDDLILEMERLKQDEGPVAEEMVNAACEEIKTAWKETAEKHGFRDTGAMIESIGIGKGPIRAGFLLYRDVYPMGKDAKGVRNAEKAFILHYGTSRIKASYWVDEADQASAEPVLAVCQDIWDEFINGNH